METNAVWAVDAFVPGNPLDKPEDSHLRGYGFAASVEAECNRIGLPPRSGTIRFVQ